VIVRINDRGPFGNGAAIDLSSGAARSIGMGGTAHVRLEVIR
jgi:rare lipoprotein A